MKSGGRSAAGRTPRVPPAPVVRAVVGLRRALLRAADAVVPAEVAVFERSVGMAWTASMATVVRMGVPDALDRPRTAADVAARVGGDADALHRVMRAAALVGLLRMDDAGRFSLTRVSRALRSDHPSGIAHWVSYAGRPATMAAWANAGHSLRTGRNAFQETHGVDVWEWFASRPQEGAEFARAMSALTRLEAPAVIAACPWPDNGTVCDVAGGVGTLLAEILVARPGLRGVLVESASVLPSAAEYLAARGLADRVDLVAHDLLDDAPLPARADVYLLKDVLHDWDDATSATILAGVAAGMSAGSVLRVVEALQERNEASPASLQDAQMLVITQGGRQRSRAEHAALLAAAGLTPGAVHVAVTGTSIVEAHRR